MQELSKQGGVTRTVASIGLFTFGLTSTGGNLYWLESGVVMTASVDAKGQPGVALATPGTASGELNYETGDTVFDAIVAVGNELVGDEDGNAYAFTSRGTTVASWAPYDERLQSLGVYEFFADSKRYVWVTESAVYVHPLL